MAGPRVAKVIDSVVLGLTCQEPMTIPTYNTTISVKGLNDIILRDAYLLILSVDHRAALISGLD